MGIMEIVLPVAVCFIVTAIAGKLLIPALVKLKAGQSIKEIGPSWHMTKQGTPTMGGLMFIIGIGLTIVVLGWQRMMAGSFVHLYVYLFALVFGVIGYIDDYQKVKHHQNTGLTAPQKFILQLAAAVAFLCLMRYEGMLSPNLYIPFWNTHIVLPWIVYLVFAAFVIVGTVNAVNITDGLDGLSSSVTVPVGLFFLVMAVIWPGFEQLGLFSGALVGGLLGFLLYNHYPAKVFMGDTGSLFLGGAVAALAFWLTRVHERLQGGRPAEANHTVHGRALALTLLLRYRREKKFSLCTLPTCGIIFSLLFSACILVRYSYPFMTCAPMFLLLVLFSDRRAA